MTQFTAKKTNGISMSLSMEHAEYVPEVERCFEGIDTGISASYGRKSFGELPMQLLIFLGSAIAGGAIYDALKIGIQKLFKKFEGAGVVIRDSEGIMFGVSPEGKVNAVVIPEQQKEFEHIKTLDDLFAYLSREKNEMGWVETTLGEVARYITNKISIQEINLNNYVSTENLLADRMGLSPATTIPALPKVTEFIKGDVLFSNIRTYFKKVWKAEFQGGASNDVLVFRPFCDNKLDKNFLFYLISSDRFINFTVISAKGTKMPRGDKDAIKGFPISLPSLPEQKAIANVLSAFDEKIELLREQNKALEETAQSIFKEWFGKYSVDKPEELPEGWRVGRLKEICEIKNGFAFKSKDYVDEGISVVRTTNFNNGSIDLNDVVYLTGEKSKEFPSYFLQKFDFLLVMVGASIGKNVIVPSKVLPALQNQNMWNFKPKDNNYRFYNIFLLKKLINQQTCSASGSARDFFRKDYFYSLEIIIPSQKEISNFTKLTEFIFEKIDNNYSQIQTLSKTRDTLLPKLMRGEVRVQF